jgi:plasmid stability protein
MPDVLVRDVDTTVLESLKESAKSNGRSLQAELQIILTRAAERKGLDGQEVARRIRESLVGREHTDSVELLREAREGR